jgi:asparagine synthase (glutamine-hydrolysing)
MSAQFGRWSLDGAPASPEYLAKVDELLSPYGPDGRTSYSRGGVDILFHAFDTTKESRLEIQPHVSASGSVITWDGRLDNRADLIGLLDDAVSLACTDVSIVSAAYERWGTECFARLIGDWAVAIWNPRDRVVVLARDPVGTRHLCYQRDGSHVTWSTVLDPLVLLAEKSIELSEEYIAGWLSHFPAAHLTPYAGIHSVPPSSFVRLDRAGQKIVKYWGFDSSRRIHYRSDSEYEEHFRTVFAKSVRRRLRSDTPVLAELSGGMDSSSIVCMADVILGRGEALTPRLDTISYYDDSEPNWNERPYFTAVERKRGRRGCHIDASSGQSSRFGFDYHHFRTAPGSSRRPSEITTRLRACTASHGNRVVLSGIGGDEFTGGLPTPVPELADLLARARFKKLAHQLKLWALSKRKPWLHLLWESARTFLPGEFVGVSEFRRPAPWLRPDFVHRHLAALTGYEPRLKFFGPLPSFQEHLSTVDALRRQLSCTALVAEPLLEKRFPYLDRELLEFVCAIPREQLVRPGQRRSLTRRALVGIVPEEILNRKRKAFVARGPRLSISRERDSLDRMSGQMVSASLGIVDPKAWRDALEKARSGKDAPMIPLLRTLDLESWLHNLESRGILERQATKTTSGWEAVAQPE